MKTGKVRHYWDTCIFLHWLSDPVKDPSISDGIEDILRRAERNELVIITSVITRIEVLKSNLTPDAADRFVRALGHAYVQSVNVDPRVAQLAHDIRDYYQRDKPQRKFKTPDCIHLASALLYACDELNTRDHALLSLSGNILNGQYVTPIKEPRRIPPPPPAPEPPRTQSLFDTLQDTAPQDLAPADSQQPTAEFTNGEAPTPKPPPPSPTQSTAPESPSNATAPPAPTAGATASESAEVVPPAAPPKPSPASES